MAVEGIPAWRFYDVRDEARPLLEKFADASLGRWTADELEQAIAARDIQLWSIDGFRAICLTSVSRRCVDFIGVAGPGWREWKYELADVVCDWAKALGKERVFANGRPGISRILKHKGFKVHHIEIVRELV